MAYERGLYVLCTSALSQIWFSSIISHSRDILVFQFFDIVYVLAVLHMYVQCPQRLDKGTESSATGIVDGWQLPCVCWELNLGLLERQPVLSTTEVWRFCLLLSVIMLSVGPQDLSLHVVPMTLPPR